MVAVCTAIPVRRGMVYISCAPYRNPIIDSVAIAMTAIGRATVRTRVRLLPGIKTNASPRAKRLAAAGGPIRPGAAVAATPGGSSNRKVSMPRSELVMCSYRVSAPSIPAKKPNVRTSGSIRQGDAASAIATPTVQMPIAVLALIVMPVPHQSARRGISAAHPANDSKPPRMAYAAAQILA
jgi:hypothetical protein